MALVEEYGIPHGLFKAADERYTEIQVAIEDGDTIDILDDDTLISLMREIRRLRMARCISLRSDTKNKS